MIGRRHFLRGLAAAPLVPLLPSLTRTAFAADKPPPRRLLIFFTPNGTNPETWFPDTGANFGSDPGDFTLKPLHSPLLTFKDKLVLLRGVHLRSTAKGAGEPHQRGMGAILTGRHLNAGDMVGGDGSTAGWATGISMDQVAAAAIGAATPRKSLELGIRTLGSAVSHRINYAGDSLPLPPMTNPVQVWDQLFKGVQNPIEQQIALKSTHKSVLDSARAQYRWLRGRVSVADRLKLDQHAAMLRALETQLLTFQDLAACAVPAQAALSSDPESEAAMAAVSRAQLDLAAAALTCDVTRVVTVQYSSGSNNIRFPHLNSFSDDHMLSHAGPSDVTSRDEWAYRQKWYASEFAYLLARLDGIPEAGGTLLDHTAVLWCSELGQGASHSHDDVPFVIGGGKGLGIPGGRYLTYAGKAHNDLHASLLTALGAPTELFGDPDYATGLLPGLLG